ncbi:Type II secretion system protein E [Caulifigura coniformis]|uniref:Type II secretion system protein E n=1 Tax=Caulifigura coniformis TaxID=2527983 RepID=A0A517S963_9PLAN|nr:GspE/PulE family protein [Caulifigura coniformis]QDT52649.1 Type II secretion system protein E [Caulifigura coniformis]
MSCFQKLVLRLLLMACVLGMGVQVDAQEPPPAAGTPATAAPASPLPPSPMIGGGDKFPPMPGGAFYRGNRNSLSPQMSPVAGGYISLWKFAPVLLLFAAWIHYGNWVAEDAASLKVRPVLWNGVQLGAGVGAMFLALTVPSFAGSFIGSLLAWGGPLAIYIKERNDRVPDSGKVMTPAHLKKWGVRQLARIGVHLGTGRAVDSVVGPPIIFIGKTRTGAKDEKASRAVETSKGYMAARELVYDAILRRATDIHIEPNEDETSVRIRIDGVMYPTEPFDRPIGDAITNIFKVLSAMDITERRRPQDGSFGALCEKREIDFRLASQGTRHGEKLSIRILDQSNSVSTLEGLGMRKQLEEKIKLIIDQPHGMFLSCGPTGAGKSTTLYAFLSYIDRYENNIITVEDPIEYKMEGVTQIEINQKSGQSFGQSLKSILRQDPDVVMIGEIRDEETAKIACQAAATGHMVFSTVHANDSVSALFRILDLGVEPFMLGGSLSAVLAQRLARRLCPHCREAYHPNPEFLKKAGLSAEKVKEFYRPPTNPEESCTHCGGLGYRGRVGVFELLNINERMRDMIRDKAAMSAIKAEARKDGMLYMKEEGLRLVVRGVTSVDELLRVVK